MLPITLSAETAIGLAGDGEPYARRRALLLAAGVVVREIDIGSGADDAGLRGLRFLFIAGLQAPENLVQSAHAAGVLVNVEDNPALCDFQVPAMVRRGDLLLTVSTGGRAPGLASVIRAWLEARFGAVWAERVAEAEAARRGWRGQGLAMAEVRARLGALVNEQGWLP